MSLTVTFSSIIAMIRLRPLSYTDTDLFILLCTLDNKDSLLNIRSVPLTLLSFLISLTRFKWIREVRHFSPNSKKVLVVTACDLADDSNANEITDNMINAAKRDLRLDATYKVSALTGENVEEM